jgi:hypothetical protein
VGIILLLYNCPKILENITTITSANRTAQHTAARQWPVLGGGGASSFCWLALVVCTVLFLSSPAPPSKLVLIGYHAQNNKGNVLSTTADAHTRKTSYCRYIAAAVPVPHRQGLRMLVAVQLLTAGASGI